MTELETMQRAKMYLDKLAQGIDPITNQEVPADSILNNVRLARCFFYVSDVLGKVIDNGVLFDEGKKLIDDHALVALTIMIAESKPEEKEMMISVIMNCLNSR